MNQPKTEANRLDFWLEPSNEIQSNQLVKHKRIHKSHASSQSQ